MKLILHKNQYKSNKFKYVASEEEFDNYYKAVDYAKELAKRNNKNLYIKDNY